MRRTVLGLGLLALLAGALVWWIPYLTRTRDFPATIAQPNPLQAVAVIDLRGGQQACFGPFTMTADSEQARFQVGTYFRPKGQPLTLTITGPGYRARRVIAGTYGDNTQFRLAVPAPPRDIDVRACIANRGTRRIALNAAADRTIAPFTTTVDGKRTEANPTFAFYEARPVSILDRLPRIVGRVRLFKPGIVGPWLIWPLLAAIVIVMPLASLWAFARVAEEEDGDDLRREPPPDDAEPGLRPPAA